MYQEFKTLKEIILIDLDISKLNITLMSEVLTQDSIMKMNVRDDDVGESRKGRGPGQVFSLIWSPVRQTQPTRSKAFQLKM